MTRPVVNIVVDTLSGTYFLAAEARILGVADKHQLRFLDDLSDSQRSAFALENGKELVVDSMASVGDVLTEAWVDTQILTSGQPLTRETQLAVIAALEELGFSVEFAEPR